MPDSAVEAWRDALAGADAWHDGEEIVVVVDYEKPHHFIANLRPCLGGNGTWFVCACGEQFHAFSQHEGNDWFQWHSEPKS